MHTTQQQFPTLHAIGSFEGPTGTVLEPEDLTMLYMLLNVGSIARRNEPVTLNGGTKSHFYAGFRQELGANPATLLQLGQYLADRVRKLPFLHGEQYNMIGIPTAGTPLAEAISLADAARRPLLPPIRFTTMRSVLKDGTHGIDGNTWAGLPDLASNTYVTVENASTTGSEVMLNLARLEDNNFPARNGMHHLVIVNRGGVQRLRAAGYQHVHAVYDLLDIVAAAVQHFALWPAERLVEYRREIEKA